MSLPTPPATGTIPPTIQRPAILQFMISHLEHGGLDALSYDLLYDVIRHMDEIALLLFPPAKGTLNGTVACRVRMLAATIAETFYRLGEHIDGKLQAANEDMRMLPDLAVTPSEQRDADLKMWRDELSKLHKPSNNDAKLYRHFLAHFDDEVHAPFLQLHRDEPDHSSWQLHHWLNLVRGCLVSLYENVKTANQLVTTLDSEYTFAVWGTTIASCFEQEIGHSPLERANDMLASLDDFFGGSESVSRTVSRDESLASQRDYDVSPASGDGSSTKVPRVFGGSFSELEDSVKNLRLHSVNSSMDSTAGSEIKVKDFALATPCLLPSPATLLERRDALVIREPTWEHRVIGGQVMKTRRPHDRNRAQTVDERGAGLEAWLAEAPSPDKAVERYGGARMRVLHRQHTL